jgi:hypothetical protein
MPGQERSLRQIYSWAALGVGVLLSVLLMLFGLPAEGGPRVLPLLTSLLACELGFIVTAIAAAMGAHRLLRQGSSPVQVLLTAGNLLLAVNFARIGLLLWAETGGA